MSNKTGTDLICEVRRVIQCNNDGVLSLKQRNYSEAIRHFHTALTIIRTRFQRNMDEDDGHDVEEMPPLVDYDEGEDIMFFRYANVVAPSKYDKLNMEYNNCSSCSSSFLFQQAFEITYFNAKYFARSHDQGRLPAFIIYNFALAHHLEALNTNESVEESVRQAKLKKALRLYELAHATHMEQDRNEFEMDGSHDEENQPEDDGGSLFEVIVILNNICQIHKELQNDTQMQRCNDQLLQTLMFLVDNGHNEIVEQLEDLFSNVLGSTMRASPVAAAA